MKALIIAWMVMASAIPWWPTHQTGFQVRWVQLPSLGHN
jgi:hypothetical protein